MATTKQLAQTLGVHPKTIKRRIERQLGFYLELAGPFLYGNADTLPDEVVTHLIETATQPGQANGENEKGEEKQDQKKAPAKPTRQNPPPAAKPSRAERNLEAQEALFGNTTILIIAASVLIAVDAISFGWIAYNTYKSFSLVAVPIFALSGMAVGFSAFKSTLAYKGWNGDSWLVGFGVFQLALHLCAMQALGEYSFFFGKIVISLGLPLASAGLALALKNSGK